MRILLPASLAAVLLIAGCTSSDRLVQPGSTPGQVEFRMSLAPARTAGICVTRVTATLTHLTEPAADSIDLAIAPDSLSASGTIDGLIPGQWRVEVGLYDGSATLIAAGSDTITVVSGQIAEATIVIAFTGSAHITVTWASSGGGAGWDDFGQGAGLDGMVLALAEYQGELIAAGDFHHAGGQPAEYIARWDGAAWHPLGAGMNGRVFDLTLYQDRLIAGGDFTQAGGGAASGIAAWDGSAWHSLGSGLSGDGFQGPWANVLAVYNDRLIAGGAFDHAGGVPAAYIAAWDGSSWSPLGSGFSGVINPHGVALTVHNGNLVAGGWFLYAGGTYVNRIASWNGSSWSAVGAGMTSVVLALATDGSTLYAVGDFTSPGAYCAMWNGSTWAPMGSGFDGNSWAAAIYRGTLYAGTTGEYSGALRVNHLANWNGSAWQEVGGGVTGGTSGAGGNVSDLHVSGDALYVAGDFTAAGGVPVHNIARWRAP